MKVRPLIQKGIVDLEKMFSEAQDDQTTLRQLRAELKRRNVPRAVVLLKKVEGSLGAFAPPTMIVGVSPGPSQMSLMGAEKSAHSSDAKPKAEPFEANNRDAASVSVIGHQFPASALAPYVGRESTKLIPRERASFTIEEAYRTLGVAPVSPWEAIEQVRRTLVDRAHPDRTAVLGEEQRELAQAEAYRINDAYAVLVRSRLKT